MPTKTRHYLDFNATAPVRAEAIEAMHLALEMTGNPSSVHSAGRAARNCVETARTQVAGAIMGSGRDLIFTSGGTEANALAIEGALAAQPDLKLIMSAVEHDAVTDCVVGSGASFEVAPVDAEGRLDLEWLGRRLEEWTTEDGIPFLALMLANNETGVIQPVREAAALVHQKGGRVHCDGVQALGKMPVNVAMLSVDSLALSAHKLGGPQGVGALWISPGQPLMAVLRGGGQEKGYRSGTQNVPGIAGFGAAAEAAVRDLPQMNRVAALRDRLEAGLKGAANVTIYGEGAARLPNTSCFGVEGLAAETQVMALDLAGVMVSAGAACSSGKVRESRVLKAMGVPGSRAGGAIRASLGLTSTQDDITALGTSWLEALKRARPGLLKDAETKETAHAGS
jgi:cysteine desulfurase